MILPKAFLVCRTVRSPSGHVLKCPEVARAADECSLTIHTKRHHKSDDDAREYRNDASDNLLIDQLMFACNQAVCVDNSKALEGDYARALVTLQKRQRHAFGFTSLDRYTI
jgi:hypothetical protein